MTAPWIEAMMADWIALDFPIMPMGKRSADGRMMHARGAFSLRGLAPVDDGRAIAGTCASIGVRTGDPVWGDVMWGSFLLAGAARAALLAGETFVSPALGLYEATIGSEEEFTMTYTGGEFVSFRLLPVAEAVWLPWPPGRG